MRATDFLGWALENLSPAGARFDAVVGNQPFIRYQYLPAEFQPRAADVFSRLGCAFTKHTNAWVPFVLASFALLRQGGRLAMVVPAEIIHVAHAQSLRTYLGEECRRLVIIDPERLWFEKTLQGAVLLLAEKRRDAADAPQGLGVVSVRDREFLSRDHDELFAAPQPINGKTVAGKWMRAFLDAGTRGLLDEVMGHPAVHRFADIADVDVGIVTGANKYFLIDDAVVRDHRLGNYAHPMFGRSEHCPGVIYDDAQHRANARDGHPTNFLWFKNAAAIQDAAVQA